MVRKLSDGELIAVGDRIKEEHRGIGGTQWKTVSRVTPKFAFVKYNDVAEGKYWREYRDFGFAPLPYQKWRMTSYSAWRPVEKESGL